MRIMIASAVTLLAFLALDVAWLAVFAAGLFKSQLGPLLREQPNLFAAAAFYLIYVAGMVILVVAPALPDASPRATALRGAMLGLTAYATFDLTNLAIISGWTLAASLADLAWGTIATALTCVAAFYVGCSTMRMDGPRP